MGCLCSRCNFWICTTKWWWDLQLKVWVLGELFECSMIKHQSLRLSSSLALLSCCLDPPFVFAPSVGPIYWLHIGILNWMPKILCICWLLLNKFLLSIELFIIKCTKFACWVCCLLKTGNSVQCISELYEWKGFKLSKCLMARLWAGRVLTQLEEHGVP